MIAKDKIKAEIERRMTDNLAAEGKAKTGHFGAAAKEDYEIIGIIDSLPDEPSENIGQLDLEKELKKWRHNHFDGKRDGRFSGEYLARESQLDLARHFAQWGAEHFREATKMIGEDLVTESLSVTHTEQSGEQTCTDGKPHNPSFIE